MVDKPVFKSYTFSKRCRYNLHWNKLVAALPIDRVGFWELEPGNAIADVNRMDEKKCYSLHFMC
jgi:hypothetical protein